MPAFLLSFFSSPRTIIVIVILIALGGAYYKYNSLQNDLEEERAALKVEMDKNSVLRDNIETLTKVNEINSKIIEQQTKSAKTTVETIGRLSNELRNSGKSFTEIQSRIDNIKTAPVPLTPYLVEAINGIQEERAKINPPIAPASALKEKK